MPAGVNMVLVQAVSNTTWDHGKTPLSAKKQFLMFLVPVPKLYQLRRVSQRVLSSNKMMIKEVFELLALFWLTYLQHSLARAGTFWREYYPTLNYDQVLYPF